MTKMILTSLAISIITSNIAFAQSPVKSRANDWAKETGTIAGSASFCKLDPETIEIYINRANDKIIETANDDTDIVVSKIEFSNYFNRASVKEPEEGCDTFLRLFPQELARIN